MVEIVKIGNKTMVVDNKLVRLFKGGKISVLAQYMGYPRFDNANNGEWSRYIKIPLTTIPNESSQYKLVITDSSLEIYSPTGSLKSFLSREDLQGFLLLIENCLATRLQKQQRLRALKRLD